MLEVGLQLSDAVPAIQELIAFVVIRFKTRLSQSVGLRLEKSVSSNIAVVII